MTELVLHGILKEDEPLPLVAPLHQRVHAGRLIGIASQATSRLLDDDDLPLLAEAQAHHELLSAFAAEITVLPVRFGTVFSDETALNRSLKAGEDRHLAWLQKMAGCVEYTLKLVFDEPHSAAKCLDPAMLADDGRGFLEKKRRVRDHRRDLSAQRTSFARLVPEKLAAAVSDMKAIEPSGRGVASEMVLLVERKSISRMLKLAEALGHEAEELRARVVLRGPGPCYFFNPECGDADHCDKLHAEGMGNDGA